MGHKRKQHPKRGQERGHMMAGVMVLVAIMGVMSGVAVQEYSEVLRRDNEAEMMFRAQELVRAIQRYRRDHGGQSPTELELLLEPGTRGQYYLRRLYEDPLAKDGEWGLLFVGPGNTIIDPNIEEIDPLSGAVSGTSGGLGGGLGGSSGSPDSRSSTGSKSKSQRKSKHKSTFKKSAFDKSGRQTGLPIAGVRTLSEDEPFRVYNGLSEYDQWLFTYFDLENAQIPGQRNLRQPRGGQAGAGGLNRGRNRGSGSGLKQGGSNNLPNRNP